MIWDGYKISIVLEMRRGHGGIGDLRGRKRRQCLWNHCPFDRRRTHDLRGRGLRMFRILAHFPILLLTSLSRIREEEDNSPQTKPSSRHPSSTS